MERLERSLQRGIAAYRWLAWVWMATVLVLARRALERPVAAVLLVGAALLVTAWLTVLLTRDPDRLRSPVAVGVEVGVGLALLAADGLVYAPPHVFTGSQPLGVAWTLAPLLAAGVAFGPLIGAATGVVAGAARAVSAVLGVVPAPVEEHWLGALTAVQVLALVTTTVLYALAGGVAGYGASLLRDTQQRLAAAERTLAEARAREDVARRLHDGVLQTLAVVERRTEDPDLARLAREQERDLRTFLLAPPVSDSVDPPDPTNPPDPADPPVRQARVHALAQALDGPARRFELAFDGRVEVLVPDDVGALDPPVVDALAGAVGEALTNAGRHGGAERVVVYVEPQDDGQVLVCIHDDGTGFDPTVTPTGIGLPRSIRGRIAEVGGDVEVVSAPGRGTEIRLTVPRA